MGYFQDLNKKLSTRVEKAIGDTMGKGSVRKLGGGQVKELEKKYAESQPQREEGERIYNEQLYGTPDPTRAPPQLGKFGSAMVRDDGSIIQDHVLKIDPVTGKLDTSGVSAVKDRALMQGDSPWAKLAQQKQGMEQSGLVSQAGTLSANQAAQNRAAMSARGGLRGGAGMRLANQAGQNSALARQGVYQQGALDRANIGLQDQQMKDQFLSQLPGAQLAAAEYGTGIDKFNALRNDETSKYNINNKLEDQKMRNTWDMVGYQEKMKALGSNRTADAIKSSQPEPGFLGRVFS